MVLRRSEIKKTGLSLYYQITGLNTIRPLDCARGVQQARKGQMVLLPFSKGMSYRYHSFESGEDVFHKMARKILLEEAPIEEAAKEAEKKAGTQKEMKLRDISWPRMREEYLDLPLWCHTSPWDEITPAEKRIVYYRQLMENREETGHAISEDSLVEEMMQSQAKQYLRLSKLIKKTGINQGMRDAPTVRIFKDGKRWAWAMAGNGNHRSILYYLLGEKSLVARVKVVVDREKSREWKNVKKSVYDENTALEMFDSVLNGSCNIELPIW